MSEADLRRPAPNSGSRPGAFAAGRAPALLSALLLAVLAGCAPDAPDRATPVGPPDGVEEAVRTQSERPTAEALGVAGPTEGPALRIQRESLLDDTRILSADSMGGRAPGTPGEERAIRHIERRFGEAGLEPVAGGSFRLPVALLGMTKDLERSTVEVAGPDGALPIAVEQNFTFWSTSEAPVVELSDVPVVFVGYGVEAPAHGWDDFKGEDVAGKVLLFLNDDPAVMEDGEPLFGGDIRTYYGRWTYKFEQAQRHGAAGAIVIHTDASAAYGFSVIGNMGERKVWQRDYRLDLLAWADSTLTHQVAEAMGTDVPGLFEMGNRRDFRPVDTGYRVTARIETEFERVEAYNVAGVVRGSDPELADEYVVFTAHHDHMGVDPGLPGDTIFSGALDNALGVAGIIALAEAFVEAAAAGELRRSAIFLSVTAEEGGLLGSGYFVENPPVPLASIVANVNVDSPQAWGPTRDVAAIGIDMNDMGTVFGEVVRSYGLTPAGDPNPMAGSFYRSDQVNFAKAGIPALYLQAGTDYARELGFDAPALRLERYHQVSDMITAEWDLTGLERDLRVLFAVALRVANRDEAPRWFPGNEFESAWRELYGR
ncbi:M28 family metallopeptidase [soil metagenome]